MHALSELAGRIISGFRLTDKEECRILMNGELEELLEGADRIRKAFCGSRMNLCSIINGRSGRCPEDCRFCAQSIHSRTGIREYGFLDPETIVEQCGVHAAKGVDRFSIVTAGRALTGKDLDLAVEAYAAMHRKYPEIGLCASHGLETAEDFRRIREAGVDLYHCNIETSRRYFPEVCTTHTFDDKIREIMMAKEAGFRICCGGIIGMGETMEDRVDMALTIAGLDVFSIPVNVLVPVKGTPLQDIPVISREEILRTVAIFRYVNPDKYLRIAAGRYRFENGGAELFRSGVNAAITGDMLTTVGNGIEEDRKMFRELGFEIRRAEDEDQY